MSIIVKTNKNLFKGLVDDFFDADLFQRQGNFNINSKIDLNFTNTPALNIREEEDSYKIELAAPGFEKEDFQIEIDDENLTIKMEKNIEIEEEDDNYNRKEFSYQSFNRSIELPENSIPEDLEATYSNGILELTLPKKEIGFDRIIEEIEIISEL